MLRFGNRGVIKVPTLRYGETSVESVASRLPTSSDIHEQCGYVTKLRTHEVMELYLSFHILESP